MWIRPRTWTLIVLATLVAAGLAYKLIPETGHVSATAETLTVDNVVASTSIQLNSATAGGVTAFDGSKKLTSTTFGALANTAGGGNTAVFLNGAGAFSTPAGGTVTSITCGTGLTCSPNTITSTGTISATATPSISIAHDTPPATVNMSTEGTVDWVILNINNTWSGFWVNGTNISTTTHAKNTGGWLVMNGRGSSLTASTTSGTFGVTFSSTAADDSTNVAANSNAVIAWFTAATTPVNFGFDFRIPARMGSQLVTRIYYSASACTVTTTAQLTISGTTATDTNTFVGAATARETITFVGGAANDELIFRYRCTTNTGSGSVTFGGASTGAI